jgi:hypothetical protein
LDGNGKARPAGVLIVVVGVEVKGASLNSARRVGFFKDDRCGSRTVIETVAAYGPVCSKQRPLS